MSKLLLVSLALVAILASVDAYRTKPIRDQWIVTFKENVPEMHIASFASTFKNTASHSILHTFNFGKFKGVVAKAPANSEYIELLRRHPHVKHVEQDHVVSVAGDNCVIEESAPWGLDRISKQQLPNDGTYQYDSDGFGVDAYIVDTGINLEHKEFDGRAIWGATFTDDGSKDLNGHGTHVAGIVGGATYGVAKNVTLIAVKVLDAEGSGTYSGVIKGINWVISSFQKRKKPSVANMSLGGPVSKAVNDAVAAAVEAGVVFAVAAGNEDSDACQSSPASTEAAITVAASQLGDTRASYSNWGLCVDIIAPGSKITSSWIGSTTATKTISGTSMASPHVCGAAARYLSENKMASPLEVKFHLTGVATKGVIDLDCDGHASTSTCKKTPNKLLFASCEL